MATHTITTERFAEGFPDGTKLNIESVQQEKIFRDKQTGNQVPTYMERHKFWRGYVSGSHTMNYDPGKYLWKAHKITQEGIDDFMESGSFLVGMTDEEFRKFSHAKPSNAKALMTSDGIRFKCEWPGCKKVSTSNFGAVEHENLAHRGSSLLGKNEAPAPEPMTDAPSDVVRRGPGRPPKASYGA